MQVGASSSHSEIVPAFDPLDNEHVPSISALNNQQAILSLERRFEIKTGIQTINSSLDGLKLNFAQQSNTIKTKISEFENTDKRLSEIINLLNAKHEIIMNKINQTKQELTQQINKANTKLQESQQKINQLSEYISSSESKKQILELKFKKIESELNPLKNKLELLNKQLIEINEAENTANQKINQLIFDFKTIEIFYKLITNIDSIFSQLKKFTCERRLSNEDLKEIRDLMVSNFRKIQTCRSNDEFAKKIIDFKSEIINGLTRILKEKPESVFFNGHNLSVIILFTILAALYLTQIKAIKLENQTISFKIRGIEMVNAELRGYGLSAVSTDFVQQLDRSLDAGLKKQNLPRLNELKYLNHDGELSQSGHQILLLTSIFSSILLGAIVWNVAQVIKSSADKKIIKKAQDALKLFDTQTYNAHEKFHQKHLPTTGLTSNRNRAWSNLQNLDKPILCEIQDKITKQINSIGEKITAQKVAAKQFSSQLDSIKKIIEALEEDKVKLKLTETKHMLLMKINGYQIQKEEEITNNDNIINSLKKLYLKLSSEQPELLNIDEEIRNNTKMLFKAKENYNLANFDLSLLQNSYLLELKDLEIKLANLANEEKHHQAEENAIEQLVKKTITPNAYLIALERHTNISSQQLKSRTATGEFQNILGETKNYQTHAASTFNSTLELWYAILMAHEDAKSHPNNSGRTELKVDFPIGLFTSGKEISDAYTIVYNYETRIDSNTQKSQRLITHIMCKSSIDDKMHS